MIFWFSGSGNSRWLAQQIAQATGDSMTSIAEAVMQQQFHYHLKPSERLGIVFPIYGWNIPIWVRTFIQHLQIDTISDNTYIYMACTYGDDMGMTGKEAIRLMTQKGWHIDSIFSIRMPNTYVCLPGFDTDSDSVVNQKLTQAQQQIVSICQDVQKNIRGKYILFPGKLPRTKTYFLCYLFRKFLMSSKAFRAEKNCVGCGICTQVCPLHNISLIDGIPHWNSHCAMCLSCYHHCPHHAVAYRNSTQKKGQWTMPLLSDKKTP